jgi:5'-nucleotidase
MSDSLEILLTNDDGIDSPGIRALYEALQSVGNVTTVAPATDQSAVGRAMSYEVEVEDHELGYAITGTPSDCVVAGLAELGPYPDLVVSGCNEGANMGAYVLGRSGTVSAAVEAAFFGVPSIAVSLHVPQHMWPYDTAVEEYAEAADATKFLAERALDSGVFDEAEYLNINAPMPGEAPAPMAVTRPSHVYDMDATIEEDTVTLHDRTWDQMDGDSLPDPAGTDRRAVYEGRVSVSPLTAPHTTQHHESLSALAETYRA